MTRSRSLVVALACLAALSAAGAACFSERQAASGPITVAGGECRIPVGSPIIGSTSALVAIRNFSFQPETVHVKSGTTVTWVNCEQTGTDAHTSTGDAWSSPFIEPGATYSHTFDATGRFDYSCIPHPFMHGVIVVE